MKEEANSSNLMQEFVPQLEKTSKLWYATFSILFLVFIFGAYGLYRQVSGGHIVTGMRDNVVWGVYIVNFIFFMGLSYAGALISGILHLFKSNWRGPVIRMAELITIISLLIGPVFIMFCIGRLERLPYLVMYPRIQSPITWDVIAISTDIIGCILFLYLSFIEDFAKLRDYSNLKLPKWRKNLYRVLSLGYQDTPRHYKIISNVKNIMAAMVIAIAIIVYSVLAWIFGVTLQPGWHSTIFGPYFVIAAVYSGAGMLIILMWIFRKVYKLDAYITKKHFVNVGVILLILAAFYGYFTFSDYLTKWYGSVKMDKMLIDKLFSDKYYLLFIFCNYIGILLPIIVVGIKQLRSITNIFVTAIITVIALWINRYLIVVPTLETPYFPIQEARTEWLSYSATWVEWSLIFAGVSVFCMLFMLASKFVPIISVSEMEKHEDFSRGVMRE